MRKARQRMTRDPVKSPPIGDLTPLAEFTAVRLNIQSELTLVMIRGKYTLVMIRGGGSKCNFYLFFGPPYQFKKI